MAADARYFRAIKLASDKLLSRKKVVHLPAFVDLGGCADMLAIANAQPGRPCWLDHTSTADGGCAAAGQLRSKILRILQHIAGTHDMLAHVATVPSRFMVLNNGSTTDLFVTKPRGCILGAFVALSTAGETDPEDVIAGAFLFYLGRRPPSFPRFLPVAAQHRLLLLPTAVSGGGALMAC